MVRRRASHSEKIPRPRPYTCGTCGHKCIRPGELKVHERKHTHETPFKCEICRRSFPTKSNLTRHSKGPKHRSQVDATPWYPSLPRAVHGGNSSSSPSPSPSHSSLYSTRTFSSATISSSSASPPSYHIAPPSASAVLVRDGIMYHNHPSAMGDEMYSRVNTADSRTIPVHAAPFPSLPFNPASPSALAYGSPRPYEMQAVALDAFTHSQGARATQHGHYPQSHASPVSPSTTFMPHPLMGRQITVAHSGILNDFSPPMSLHATKPSSDNFVDAPFLNRSKRDHYTYSSPHVSLPPLPTTPPLTGEPSVRASSSAARAHADAPRPRSPKAANVLPSQIPSSLRSHHFLRPENGLVDIEAHEAACIPGRSPFAAPKPFSNAGV